MFREFAIKRVTGLAHAACRAGQAAIVIKASLAGHVGDFKAGDVVGICYGVRVHAEFDTNDLAVAMHCDIDAERCS